MPTEAEVQTQWRNVVDILETMRNHADGTMAPAGGLFDTLQQSLEGQYTPDGLASATANMRALYAAMIAPSTVLGWLSPLLFEYGGILAAHATLGFGSGYRNVGELFSAIYEWFVANSLTVQSRAITYDTTATAGGSNVGNGAVSRLTVDENAFNLEACTVEKKVLRCRQDQNTGTKEEAEEFECFGSQESQDSLLRAAFGSGEAARTFMTSHHAGSGRGGSLLTNSSFSTFDSTATPKFSAWTETAGGAQLAQDTTNFYRSNPGGGTDASLRINGGGGTVTITQPLTAMRVRRLDPNTPYFLRVMVNPTVGTASGGTFTIRMGSQEVDLTVASMSAGWQELLIPIGVANWPRVFNADPLTVEIEWTSSTSGFLLVDDVLFAPFDLWDGTWWFLRANAASPTPWLVDDTLLFTDTGGAPATGQIQWWLYVAGLGYLPSTTGTPTFADP